MGLSDHNNWLFVSFTQGSFGHMIARHLATSPNVQWYDHPKNGKVPWEWNHFTADQSYSVSSSHFLRYFDTGTHNFEHSKSVPAFGWFLQGKEVEPILFQAKWLNDILDQKIIVYPTHDYPHVIRELFPNSRIIVVDVDEEALPSVLKNQFEKTSNYRSIRRIPDLDNSKKINWANEFDQDIIRDWEQFNLGLNQNEWFDYTCNWIINDIIERKKSFSYADYTFQSKNKTNLYEVVKMHEHLGIEYNRSYITKVLNAFDLDSAISNYLNRWDRTRVSHETPIE